MTRTTKRYGTRRTSLVYPPVMGDGVIGKEGLDAILKSSLKVTQKRIAIGT